VLDGGQAAEAEEPEQETWQSAARLQSWPRALELARALPEDQQKAPTMRLAMGRFALGAGEHAAAVTALKGLEEQLPTLRAEIRRWYAEAAAVAGPFEEAGTLLAKSALVKDLILAAKAYERGGKTKLARTTLDRAVKRASRNRRQSDETQARMARAALAERTGNPAVALADWRWVVKSRPKSPRVLEALAGTTRLGGKIDLETELFALSRSATQEHLNKTLARLDELAAANKAQGPRIALARGQALYYARTYTRARDGLDYAAALVSPFQAEALYYGGRAAERADDVAGALSRFDKVIKKHPRAGWAERAAFNRAALLLYHGSYPEAEKAYTHYLAHYGRTKWVLEARYGLALARLSTGKAIKAKETFVALGKEQSSSRRFRAQLKHLEGLAALRAERRADAVKIWTALIEAEPLTYPALAARARLKAIGHEPLPPIIGPPPSGGSTPVRALLPTTAAMLHSIGLDAAAERRIARSEQDLAARFPGRESEALCSVYGKLAGARRELKTGTRAASLEVLMKAPSAAERWAWSCVYPRPYAAFVRRQEQQHQVPNGLVHAIMRQESAFREQVVSPAGAQGLMQLMPNTAKRAAAEMDAQHDPAQVFRPDVNIPLGAFYIGKLLRSFQRSTPVAVAGYNAGPHAARRWLGCSSDREADLWVARIPYFETRNYVARVLSNLARYQYLAGGVEAVTELSLELPESADIGDDAY
jgi:soluble lytic murein transglycosylase